MSKDKNSSINVKHVSNIKSKSSLFYTVSTPINVFPFTKLDSNGVS